MGVSEREVSRRIDAIRRAMAAEHLPAIVVFSSTELCYKGAARYISGYHLSTRNQFIILPLAGDPVMIVPTIGQQYWARSSSWIGDIRSGGETETMIREVARAIKAAGLDRGRVGMVNLKTALPHHHHLLLSKELPGVAFEDATDLFDRVRMVKSEEEIEQIRQTAAIADRCYDAVLTFLRPGVNERDVMAEVFKGLGREGAEDILILTARGPSFPCFISQPASYVFEQGDLYVFSVEISGPGGYWSQIIRPLCLGPPPSTYVALFEAARAAMARGVEELMPGKRAGEVARVIGEEARRRGFKTGIWCGHGMGIDLGDGLGLSEENDLELQAGMVVTVHPHVMTPDGKEGLLIGDTFVVRDSGPENLSGTTCELKSL